MSGPAGDLPLSGRSEPAIKAPAVVLAVIAALIAAHAARLALGVAPERFALSSADLARGRWGGVVSYMFVHGGWIHLLLNSVFILAFGTPVARRLGRGARGALAFIAFFLTCGVAAGAGYAALADGIRAAGLSFGPWAVVGASGAASGLMGAAARLMEGRGRLGPLWGGAVTAMTAGWVIVNVLFGVTGAVPGTDGAPVAWEAHIMGYLAGLLLIGVFDRLAGHHAEVKT
jgi:membrane associated rhomboid family serine protease